MKGRPAIPPELKDPKIYKNVGVIARQKEYSMNADLTAELKPPKNLTKGAKKEWCRVVKLYKQLEVSVLNDLDMQVLASYCIEVDIRNKLYDRWTIDEKIKVDTTTNAASFTTNGSGRMTRGNTGQRSKTDVNPLLMEIMRHNKTIAALADQLALTPASRAAYAVRKEKESRSEIEVFMGDE